MKTIVAIEVSRDAIRAAEVSAPFSKNPTVVKIGEIELSAGAAGESQVHELDSFVESLNKLWEEQEFSTRTVALVVSGRRFIVRSHETAHTSMKTLRSVLPYEAATVVPEGMQNPIIDFFPTSHLETKNGLRTEGMVIATPAEPIESIIGALVRAKLKIEYVDFAPMAIARFIKKNIDAESYGESYALANIRELSTDILVTKGSVPKMIRVAAVGLAPPQKKVGKHAKDSEYGSFVSSDGNIGRTPIEALAKEISVTISSQDDELGVKTDTLYVTGPRSDQETIDKLAELLKMNVVSLTSETANHKEDIDTEYSASEFVAVCAGMRGKN